MNQQQIEDPVPQRGTEKFKPLAITRLIQLVSERLALDLIEKNQNSKLTNCIIDDSGVNIIND